MRAIAVIFVLATFFAMPGWYYKDGYREAKEDAEWCVNYNLERGTPYKQCFQYKSTKHD